MQHAIIALVTMTLVFLLALPAVARNLVLNGRFEGPDTDGVPQNWSFHNWRQDQLASGKVVRGGTVGPRCLQLSSPVFPADYAAYCRPVDVSEWVGKEVLFTCYFRTVEHPQAQITIATYAEPFAAKEFDTPELHSEAYLLGESHAWQLVTWHISCMPASRDLVVLLRVMGGGSVFFDGVALRPVGSEVEVELEQAGTITAMPATRSVSCSLHNLSQLPKPIRLNVQAKLPNGRVQRATANCELAAGERKRLGVNYRLDFRSFHDLRVQVMGEEPDEVYQAYERTATGLISARIIQPAFRSSVLASIPTDKIIVEGRFNASEEIVHDTELTAEFVATGATSREVEPLTDAGMMGPWRITLPLEGMLTGKYEVQVKAKPRRGSEQVLSLPVSRPRHSEVEVAYDTKRRLWVHGQPVFPLGICRIVDAETLPAMREVGFNFVITPFRSVSYDYADAAQDAGIQVAVSSSTLEGLFWRNLTDKYLRHPALLGWYGVERPDTQLASPGLLEDVYRHATGDEPAVADLDPYHPVLLTLRANSTLDDFAKACDIVLVWTEPVPRWPITTVADAVEQAIEATGGAKPIWAMVQSTGLAWTEARGFDPEGSGRPPTAAEHRAMVYLALMSGADGLAYYSYRLPPRQGRPAYSIKHDAPELWEGIKETNKQLAILGPAFANSEPQPIELPEGTPIRMVSLTYEDAEYLIAVNTSDTASAVSFEAEAKPQQELPVLFEQRTLVASDTGSLADVFEPYAVHVYLKSGEPPAVNEPE